MRRESTVCMEGTVRRVPREYNESQRFELKGFYTMKTEVEVIKNIQTQNGKAN